MLLIGIPIGVVERVCFTVRPIGIAFDFFFVFTPLICLFLRGGRGVCPSPSSSGKLLFLRRISDEVKKEANQEAHETKQYHG
jgi:hypothetical protein